MTVTLHRSASLDRTQEAWPSPGIAWHCSNMTAATQVHLATAADLLRLPGDVRAEIIDGEIVEKAGSLPEHGIA